MGARAEDDVTPSEEELRPRPVVSGWVRREELPEPGAEQPTRQMEGGVEGYVSRIDEIRRLYAEGSAEDALLLAGTVSPPPQLGWSLESVPVLAVDQAELMTRPLDHRAGFVLAHVDGATTLESILDIVPMPEGEVLAVVEALVALGIIRLESARTATAPRATRRTPT